MTKPIYEPNEVRETAKVRFKADQLLRRPSLGTGTGDGAGACLPYAVIGVDFSPAGQTIASSTETDYPTLAPFTDSYASDPTILDVDLATGEIIYFTAGVHLAEATLEWETPFAGTKIVTVVWSSTQFDLTTAWKEELETSSDHTHSQSLVITGTEGNRVTANFEQQSGSPQTLLRASLKVIRLAEYPQTSECGLGTFPWAKRISASDTSIPNNTLTALDLGAALNYTSDTDIFEMDGTTGITVKLPRLCLVKWAIDYASAFSAVHHVGITGTTGVFAFEKDIRYFDYADVMSGSNVIFVDEPPETIHLSVRQLSGVTQNCGGRLYLFDLGMLGGDTTQWG